MIFLHAPLEINPHLGGDLRSPLIGFPASTASVCEQNRYICGYDRSEKVQISEIGIEVSGITSELGNKLFLDNIEGLLITNVNSVGLGKIIGLKRDDVIVEVDQAVLHHPLELKNYIRNSLKNRKSTLVLIFRNNEYAHFLIKY